MVEKILAWHAIFGHQRTLIQLGVDGLITFVNQGWLRFTTR